MFTTIDSSIQSKREQKTCPVCSSGFINEHTVNIDDNLVMQVYECTNQHSWKKYPHSRPTVIDSNAPQAHAERSDFKPFADVYRPLQDTTEPVKRLFKGN